MVIFYPNCAFFVDFDVYFLILKIVCSKCIWIFLWKNNLQIEDIGCNLELLHCILKRHFETILHLHVFINLGLFFCIIFFVKNNHICE